MPASSDVLPSPDFMERFRTRAGEARTLRFDEFVDLALFDRDVGYYRRPGPRVGYGPGTDFFTASSSGPLFGELVVAACRTLLGGDDPARYTFVELGAETGEGVLCGVPHPFAGARTVRIGEPLELSGDCIVFSNELLDAQPFRRFLRTDGAWEERGVTEVDSGLVETAWACDAAPLPDWLPSGATEGYRLDVSLAAADLTSRVGAQPWRGLFLTFDYGKTWSELAQETPGGTARAYYRHQQSNDLLARPGCQDLTCHVCWDWITERLERAGFVRPQLEFQESFFVHQAAEAIAATMAAEATRMSPRKLSLLQLLHPSHLGQKFQALHAFRPAG